MFMLDLEKAEDWKKKKKKKKERKGRGTRNQIDNICYIIEKARVFHKSINFIDYAKAFDCWSELTVENS